MERIQLFHAKKLTIRFLLAGSIFFFLFGISHLIYALINGFEVGFPGDWMSVIFIIQGILYVIWTNSEARKSRYFISWDKKVLKYLLPNNKTLVSLAISEIESVKMNGIEICIQTKEDKQKLRLEYIEWKELNGVKELIGDLSLSLSENKSQGDARHLHSN